MPGDFEVELYQPLYEKQPSSSACVRDAVVGVPTGR